MDSADLFKYLWGLELFKNSPKYWWPNPFSVECIVGVILTQNTKWENVQKSLRNLATIGFFEGNKDLTLKKLSMMDSKVLESLIVPSGFYRQKASRLVKLANEILSSFGDFRNFVERVDREWLLAQKGIGFESADSILNYACGRAVMVIDKYTQKLVASLGYEFMEYENLQEWMEEGIVNAQIELLSLSGADNLAHLFMLFHGLIVEVSKKKIEVPRVL